MSKVTGLSWGDRFALIDKYKPTDEQVDAVFGLNAGELETARELRAEGNFGELSEGFDPEAYDSIFASIGEGAVSVSRPTSSKPAVTATKTTPAPKKRGRKGTKIAEAFGAIGTEAVPAEEFANTRGVSLNVLRQAKRFDKTGGARVRVKKIDGTLMVYRESE